ncbi:3-hydroxyacyl-CoA dehydrogenase/enoyl-CoA hydratase/3-hydroxybutyryl-CoA epimerase [Kribbella sp. VKM Ac-2527]|uniref:3-hydroxyacyl-CoA dehydrogenase/enoyl-CoA hydratase/3-hydroxybutyryl-CoA epimerase n=1 Tax=Kribbella caucasensis TaxID=2512215 RepID=A0A4R6KB05_9ACTN|nr:3-hydroxyacyl-CoA dehydrogenase NAD-binding domain-containing protein [Kribbella sp. VKM Ac-2527]TDO45383.1 3-hydroxyacyl-CoA dehydrogenase/enoyl-CoA hydratase/3-hydroxybutyryl-CoA epimerase [Kribbella sp. VKM Ac-2527]
MISWDLTDGVVMLTMDDPDASANTMNDTYIAAMAATVERLQAEKDALRGVIITSAKSTFFAGGNLRMLSQIQPSDAAQVFETLEEVKRQLRVLETLGVPVVAAINGSALGGGLEIALACHHRIVADDNRIELGVPEVTLGLLPGGGGVTRTVRMLGLQDALMKVLLQGQRMKPANAKSVGIVDEVVPADQLLTRAREWIDSYDGDAKQPWDRDGYKIPGGTPSSPKLAAFLPAFPANLRKQLKGAPYPAPKAIMSAAVEGSQVDFATASRIESRYFVSLATGQIAKNMINAFFFELQAINAGASRPADVPPYSARKVGVLGAGMMGAGIAYVCAKVGIEVVLKDVSLEAAEKGKAYSEKLLAKQIQKGRSTPAQAEEFLSRITPTADPNELAGCDLVIEAVFESEKLKQDVFAEIAGVVEPDALLCSNTSTLPITSLADGIDRPDDFIGMHFFSPVDRMQLVELIVGEKTSDRTLAKAYDVVRQIKKTPIVVNDSRGFFTSRVFGTLVMEGAAMVAEGLDPVTIERAATQMGFPAPPLAMLDEVTLTLPQKIRDAARAAGDRAGAFDDHPGMAVADRLVNEFDRKGKAAGAGFYEYPADGQKHLWPGLWEHFVSAETGVPFVDLQERMTFAMALETVKCLDEGVLRSVADANIGSIFGIGFPPLHGGAVQYVNAYAGGLPGFVARTRELAAAYGARFEPPALLVRKAEAGETF